MNNKPKDINIKNQQQCKHHSDIFIIEAVSFLTMIDFPLTRSSTTKKLFIKIICLREYYQPSILKVLRIKINYNVQHILKIKTHADENYNQTIRTKDEKYIRYRMKVIVLLIIGMIFHPLSDQNSILSVI